MTDELITPMSGPPPGMLSGEASDEALVAWLAEAGLEAIVVASCPAALCPSCQPGSLTAAA